MKKVYLILAAAVGMTITSCTTNDYLGDVNNDQAINDGSIQFGLKFQNMTRADIYGNAAAELLGKNFYVMGTKGTGAATHTEPETSPTTDVVFDNYLVHWGANTANTTESNTANWEYVGVVPGTSPTENYVKTGSYSSQTIKYWDYSTTQYDFFAFSTGPNASVTTTPTNNQIGVTTMVSGASLASNGTAYTLTIPRVEDLKETFITDIKKVLNAQYGKEVQLTFKNVGAKVRVALYETIPGYSVKDVKFYASETTPRDHTADGYVAPTTTATLINANATGFTTSGQIKVSFPFVGYSNDANSAYDKADAQVTPTTGVKTQTFGTLDAQLNSRYDSEDETATPDKLYLGKTLPTATFAGDENADFYQAVFPAASTTNALTLRVDYTLVSTDGSKEEINVYGASAVVPAEYTKWQPNYAYTYIFKISDNTNGWTSETVNVDGLHPITFDAVVVEATDANAEQTTITTVATPSITTYQQYHSYATNEYSKSVKNKDNVAQDKDIYVRIMNTTDRTVVNGLSASNSLIYELSRDDASEAEVMDALKMRKTAVGTISTANVTGRNNLVLTNVSTTNISNTETQINNGVDDQPITGLTSGTLAKIDISALTAGKSYAYVYIATTPTGTEVDQFEPIAAPLDPGAPTQISNSSEDTFYALAANNIGTVGEKLNAAEAPNADYIYFSKTENGTGTATYSYISPLGKDLIPAGCWKVAKSKLTTTVTGNAEIVDGTFYFDKYIKNGGVYAVKVIKIVS